MLLVVVVCFSWFSHVFRFRLFLVAWKNVFFKIHFVYHLLVNPFFGLLCLSAPCHTPFMFNCRWPVTALPWRECCHWSLSVFLDSFSILTKHTRMLHVLGAIRLSWKHVEGTNNSGKHTRMRHTGHAKKMMIMLWLTHMRVLTQWFFLRTILSRLTAWNVKLGVNAFGGKMPVPLPACSSWHYVPWLINHDKIKPNKEVKNHRLLVCKQVQDSLCNWKVRTMCCTFQSNKLCFTFILLYCYHHLWSSSWRTLAPPSLFMAMAIKVDAGGRMLVQ
jgi:hypothetical protein